jgi:hypothetical protein
MKNEWSIFDAVLPKYLVNCRGLFTNTPMRLRSCKTPSTRPRMRRSSCIIWRSRSSNQGRDSARSNPDQPLKSGAAFTGSDEARKTLEDLER